MEEKNKTKVSNKNNQQTENESKNEGKNPWQILLFALIIILLFYLFYAFLGNNDFLNKKTADNIEGKYDKTSEVGLNFPKKNNLPEITSEELEANYRDDMNKILAAYNEIKGSADREEWSKFSRDYLVKVFQMVVPADKKDFHLELAIALNAINVAAARGEDNLEEKIEDFNKIIESWQ